MTAARSLALLALAGTLWPAAAITVSTAALPAARQGILYSAQLQAADANGIVTWDIQNGNLPPGLVLGALTGIIAGIPTQLGTFDFTVRARDNDGPATASLSITVGPRDPLTITTTSLPQGTVGAAYNAALEQSGGAAPFTWSAQGLPPGLNVTGSSITGTPTTAGSFDVTLTVGDGAGGTAQKTLPLVIQPPALTVMTSSLPAGMVGRSYSTALAATGGVPPYTWSATGLPAGVRVEEANLTGIPGTAGTSNPSIQVRDSLGATASRALPLAIVPALAISTSSLPGGVVGQAYSASVAATGGMPPYTWSATGLPGGVSLSGDSIGGTPNAPGDFQATVQVRDSAGFTESRVLTVSIAPPLSVTTSSLPNGTSGRAYNAPLAATGGTPPYTWSAEGLPTGLSVNGGAITGTPTASGTFNVTVQVRDSAGRTASRALSLSIAAPLAVSTSSLPNGTAGQAYNAQLAATGGTPPYTWSAEGLPAGLSVNGAAIAGTPSGSGPFNVTVQARDSAGLTASRVLTLTLSPALVVTTSSLPTGTAGQNYNATLAATGGTPPYSWSATGLPTGLAVSGSTITGTPGQQGAFNVTLQVRDSAGVIATRPLVLSIGQAIPPLEVTTNGLAPAIEGQSYSATLAASGGVPPYQWLALDALPAGLSLGTNGVISGTPATSGVFPFRVQATDSRSTTASRSLELRVIPRLSIVTPPELTGGAVGQDYSAGLQSNGGEPPITWTVASGALPGGVTLATNGVLRGRPNAAGQFRFTLQARDAVGQAVTREFTLNITSTLSISSASPLPQAAVGTAYSYSFAALAGSPPYRWEMAQGNLPPGLGLNTSTGVLSGTPTQQGTFEFTVRVIDAGNANATKGFSITVANALTITSETPLPDATVGAPYSVTLSAVAGTSPYSWRVSAGTLPAGLNLAPASGAIAGTPTQQGNAQFTVEVTDAVSARASKQFTLNVAQEMRITTAGLPAGTTGLDYAADLAVAGGKTPYRWAVAQGALPPGLSLNTANGRITGTPETVGDYSFVLEVSDAGGLRATQSFTLRVGLTAVPALQINGLPATSTSLQQPALTVRLASPYTSPISGQLTLTFAPDAAVAVDDPAIQFSTGSRLAAFNIPAGTTDARFSAQQMALQTGSIAGTIVVRAQLSAGGVDVTPSPAPQWTIQVARAAPMIRSARLVPTASGFEVWITGLSNSRELNEAVFRFTPASGTALETTEVRVPLANPGRQWYQDSASALFGSQFTIVQPFTQGGPAGTVSSVQVTLSNAQGSSTPAVTQQ